VPFVPVDSNRELMEQRALDLQTWSEQQGWPLIVVQGLQVLVSAYQISPGAVADLEPVLAHDDVTHQVLRAIVVLQKEATGTAGAAVTTPGGSATPAGSLTTTDAGSADGPAALPAQSTADPGEVERIGDALAADRIYNDPALSAQTVDQRWANVGPGLVVRAAFLPPAAPGRTLPDLITPLSKRFPGDVVVVMRGRWMEVAGPEQEMLDSATLWLYGNYMKPFLRWDVQPTQFVALLAGQIGLLRTGVVSDQSSPVTPNDPVNSARSWLPWLFAATALVLAGAAGWWAGRSRRNSRIAAEAAQRQGILRRRRIGARLAGVAGGIIELDALAQNRTAQDERDAAVERYRVARDLLTDDGDLEIAGDALEAAERHLVSAGRALGTPTASRAPRRGSPDGPS
jgi:hypothetical protein